MKTIKDVEGQAEKNEKLCEALKELGFLPRGYAYRVRILHGEEGGRRRDASFQKYWSADSDSIRIGFQPTAGSLETDTQSAEREGREIHPYPCEAPRPEAAAERPAPGAASPNHPEEAGPSLKDRFSDLIRALERAESRPGYSFVALKWFRDTILPEGGFLWADDEATRQTVLRDAIDKQLILTSRMPNPRSPQFPVTAIRLNRLMPEVKAILGNSEAAVSDFRPVSIRGESLSQTVLRDRR